MSYGFTFPVAGGSITSEFGDRVAPKHGASTKHPGIDISVPIGTSVMSALSGIVAAVGYSSAKGNYITVDHGSGVTSTYEHLSSIVASKGQGVTQGQKIAISGNTGISTGPHLHFEIRKNGEAVDPLTFSASGGGLVANMDTNLIVNLVKKHWLIIAGGLVILTILR